MSENIIPSSEIHKEHMFTEYQGKNFLSGVLNQADYFGPNNMPTNTGDGQCLAVSVGEVMQAKLKLSYLKQGEEADPPAVSIQQLVDDMSPKPRDYPEGLFTHLQTKGIVADQDYKNAPIMSDGSRNLEGVARCGISSYQQYYCGPSTRLQSHRRDEAISDLMNFGPLVGEMNATKELWEYRGGILTGKNYATNSNGRILSHAAMIVGVGITTSN